MSFLKKITKEFDELKSSFLKDDEKKEEKKEVKEEKKEEKYEAKHADGARGFDSPAGYQPHYDQPPQILSPPPGAPGAYSLPPGWAQQWDPSLQRWYYVDQGSGKTQWNVPTSPPPERGYLPLGHDISHGYGGGYNGNYNQTPQGVPQTFPPGGQTGQPYPADAKPAKDKGHGGMIAGAAGGLAVGAIGGALVEHAMDDDSSDDEHHRVVAAAPPSGYGQESYYSESTVSRPGYGTGAPYGSEAGPPGVLPDETRSGSSVSSSDKEDVQEAREEYENASASDKEEAREDYEEEYRETYDE